MLLDQSRPTYAFDLKITLRKITRRNSVLFGKLRAIQPILLLIGKFYLFARVSY